jgi:PAS domain S-box-containing protein
MSILNPPIEALLKELSALRQRISAYAAAEAQSKQNEEQRRLKEEQFQAFWRTTKEWLWTIDLEGKRTSSNPALETILGHSPEEFLGRDCLDYLHMEDQPVAEALLKSRKARKEGWSGQVLRWRHKDGSYRYLESTAVPILDLQGNLTGYQGADRDITEHKWAEEALRESEQKFRALFDNARDTILIADLGGNILEVNRQACEQLGYSRNEFLRMAVQDIDPPEQAALVPERLRMLIEQGQLLFETAHKRRDGTVFPIEVSSRTFELAGEKLILSVCRDISMRKRVEAELQESYALTKQIISCSQVGILVVDRHYCHIVWNPAMEAVTGVSADQALGKTPWEVFPFLKESEFTSLFEHVMAGAGADRQGSEKLFRNPRTNRSNWLSAHLTPLRNVNSEIVGVIATVRDITERKQTEERLAKLSLLKQRLIGTGSVKEKLQSITDRVVEIFGADFARIWMTQEADLCEKGCPHAQVTEGPDVCRYRSRCLHLVASSGRYTHLDGGHRRVPFGCYKIGRVATGEDPKFITNDVTRDHRVHDHEWAKALGLVSFAGYRLVSSEGKPVGVLALFSQREILPHEENLLEDLANAASQVVHAGIAEEDRRELETQVQQAQKLESLGVLAGGIAHDFNNLLTAILGHADLALADLTPESPARENLIEIEQVTRRAAELCRQMLAYSGRGRFVVEPLHLSRLVQELTHLLQVSISKKAMLRCHFAEDLPAIEADPAQMRQVVMNLVINASEAIGDQEGIIAVTTGVMTCDALYLQNGHMIASPPAGTYVYLEVTDTGSGMDAATQAKIFDPFFTTKFTGRGLGLAAVLGIMRSHNGAIKVHSELGKGSTFRVLFPASVKAVESSESETPAELWHGTGTILLVDDEDAVRNVTRKILERCGFRVIAAADGREAISLFQEHAHEVACVLLDLTMPYMDGEETFRELRRIRPDARVIIASGYSEQEITRRFAGQALAGFIEKPYQMTVLNAKLREVLMR